MQNIKLKLIAPYDNIERHIPLLLANNTVIEELYVLEQQIARVEVLANNISRLKSIRTLKIQGNDVRNHNYLLELAKNLPNVEKLEMELNMKESILPATEMIVKILKFADRLSELSFHFFGPNKIVPYADDDYNTVLRVIKDGNDQRTFKIKIKNLNKISSHIPMHMHTKEYIHLHMDDRLMIEHLFEEIHSDDPTVGLWLAQRSSGILPTD